MFYFFHTQLHNVVYIQKHYILISFTDGWRLDVTLSSPSSEGAVRNLVNAEWNSSPQQYYETVGSQTAVPYMHIGRGYWSHESLILCKTICRIFHGSYSVLF